VKDLPLWIPITSLIFTLVNTALGIINWRIAKKKEQKK